MYPHFLKVITYLNLNDIQLIRAELFWYHHWPWPHNLQNLAETENPFDCTKLPLHNSHKNVYVGEKISLFYFFLGMCFFKTLILGCLSARFLFHPFLEHSFHFGSFVFVLLGRRQMVLEKGLGREFQGVWEKF